MHGIRTAIAALLLFACGNPYVLNGYRSPMGVRGMRRRAHAGVDFKGNIGDPVIAAAPGLVVSTLVTPCAGVSVLIRHGDARYTAYLHMSEVDVHAMQRVVRGEEIGKVGDTGWCSGGVAHVHLQLCSFPCATGTADGDFNGVEDPMANGAACFDPRRTYSDSTLTYPVVCRGVTGVPVPSSSW